MPNNHPKLGEYDTSYKAAGENAGIEKLVSVFFSYMDSLPEARQIRAMHPADLDLSKDKLTRFLCGWLGGPKLYREKYGPIRIPLAHAHLPIDVPQRDAWLLCMQKAVDEQSYTDEFKKYLMAQLYIPAERIRSVGSQCRAAASDDQ